MIDAPDQVTVVLGVDARTLSQLRETMPTWRRHCPGLFAHRFLIFYDRGAVSYDQVLDLFDATPAPVTYKILPWPSEDSRYAGDGLSKWTNPQRHKMLAGFVHAPARHVETPYWLKIDTDVVALRPPRRIWGPDLFTGDPAIVAPAWGYTKPPGQMLDLDRHFAAHAAPWAVRGPLRLHPDTGANKLRHQRICSWLAFFQTSFSVACAQYAEHTCGRSQIPVPSQDGYIWYCAMRAGLPIVDIDPKANGWVPCGSARSFQSRLQESEAWTDGL